MIFSRYQSFRTFVIWLVILTFLALVLGANREVEALTVSGHDDRLFVNLAVNILKGRWLGDFNQFTLMKGSFYPIFLAINYILGFPLLITQQVLYCFSGIALIYALSSIIRSRWTLLIIYTVYIFNPIAYVISRVVREGIYISLTALVVAGTILVFLHLSGNRSDKHLGLHASLLGISLGCFWLTREEGVWLFPCIAMAIAIGVFSSLWQHHSYQLTIRKLVRLLLPTVGWFLGILLFTSLLNYLHYGVLIPSSELSTREFKDAYGSLLRVKKSEFNSHVPVPKEVRQKLYAQSEKFRQLQPSLENPTIIAAWSAAGCPIYPSSCGDYAGGWFVWVFRDAVEVAGYYKSAPQALGFYRDLATEINNLCNQKRLDCGPPQSGIMPALNTHYMRQLFGPVTRGLRMVASLFDLSVLTRNPSISIDLDLFQEITHNRTSPLLCANKQLEVIGWFSVSDYKVKLSEQPEGYIKQTQMPSPDLITAFKDASLGNSRFKLELCCVTCSVSLETQGKEIFQIELLGGLSSGLDPSGLRYNLESVKNIEKKEHSIRSVKMNLLEIVNVIFYKHLLFFVNAIAAIIWLVRLIGFRYIPWSPICSIATVLLIAIMTRILILSLVEITSFPGIGYYYLSACIPFVSIFSFLVISDTLASIRQRSSS